MKKMKADVIENIIICILILILVVCIFLRINNVYVNNLKIQSYVNTMMNSDAFTIIDSTGANVTETYKEENSPINIQEKINKVYEVEAIILIVILILELVIIVGDINRKFSAMDKATFNILDNIKKLEINENKHKYIEINNIYENINKAIYDIKQKEDYKNRVLENLAHDILTPIHIIKGNIELYEHNLNMDIKSVKINLEKLEKLAILELTDKSYEFEILTSEKIKEYLATYNVMSNKVKFSVEIEENIEIETKIAGFYRIIDNIVNNAIKHGKASVIVIKFKQFEDEYRLMVINNGIVIEKEVLGDIFNRKYSTNGTGLGLSIVKEIVEDLDYKIYVKSKEGQTAFIIVMPKYKGERNE